jgi:cyclic pyranopterin phosphate synthase
MPQENMKFMPGSELMSASEIVEIAAIYNNLGVDKIRLTGGEPLLRKDMPEILRGLSQLNAELSVTTNAFLLDEFLDLFDDFGLKNINISIDSIDRAKFRVITRRDAFDRVMRNIELARERGFKLKFNVVVIRHFNEFEISNLLRWAADFDTPIRFIEYMPFSGNDWVYEKVVTQVEMLDILRSDFEIEELSDVDVGTATKYITSEGAEFGIIPTVSNPFCGSCSRLRVTADGKMKNCLFSSAESDLKSMLRNGEDIETEIRANLYRKKFMAAGKIDFSHEQAKAEYAKNRAMVAIGG